MAEKFEQLAPVSKAVLTDLMELANREINREQNARKRQRIANYWLGRCEARFPEFSFGYDQYVNITFTEIKREVKD